MTRDDVQQLVDTALDELPEDIYEALADVEILVAESRADTEVLRAAVTISGEERAVIPQNFRGVFLGVALSDADDDEAPEPETCTGAIVLNAAMMKTGEDVIFTFFHEIGHALGLDEDEVAALGLG